ncbi:hypothetical protein MFRU_004g02220 [Monilinia fructicola]|uniref:Zn(2)-C6 fungal-type domain-containing protein n=1 Tax=Monilinia fructicola TaxID=38448 RepID=A0A5M9JM45_MONFR|nr:hypothetical protein EYC84_001078 [Monilinia fructicola]KAG4033719.1 hypothetical protein MFRU_004g02220 [Monilinia fructicola]
MTRSPPEDGSQYPLPTGPSDNNRFPPYSSPSVTSQYAPTTGSSDSHRVVYTPTSTEYPSPPVAPDNRAPYTPNQGSQYSNPQDAPDNRASYTSNNGSHIAAQNIPDSRMPYRTAMNEPQHPSDSRLSHQTSTNEPNYPANNRMGLSSSYDGAQHHPPPTMDHHSQNGWGPHAHTSSNGYPELHRASSSNGPQYSALPMASVQDARYSQTSYSAPPPGYPYPDARGYQPLSPYKAPSPPRQTMTFKQNAPRQRTAIACKYCRRRKIRCSGFNADGSAGRCSNCERFKQDCIFTPVSSQQAFVPIQAVYAANGGNTLGPNTQLYGAHGQPLPMNSSAGGSNHMFQPPQSSFEPQLPPHPQPLHPQPQQLPQPPQPPHPPHPPHSLNLPSMSRSPYDQNTTLPSPTGSLDSQRHKRPTDEQHYGRLPPPAPGSSSTYQREENFMGHRSIVEDERYRSTLPPPPSHAQNYGYQRGENNVTHRPIEDSRQMSAQLAPAYSNEAPQTFYSPNGSSSSLHSQRPTGNFPLPHLPPSPRGFGRSLSSQTPPAGTSSGGRQNTTTTAVQRPDPMAISNFVANDRDIDQGMLGRLSQSRR